MQLDGETSNTVITLYKSGLNGEGGKWTHSK